MCKAKDIVFSNKPIFLYPTLKAMQREDTSKFFRLMCSIEDIAWKKYYVVRRYSSSLELQLPHAPKLTIAF